MTYVSTQTQDDYYAEEYNGAVLLNSLSNIQATFTFPTDMSGSVWASGKHKIDMLLCEVILSDTNIKSGGSSIELSTGKSSGTATLRIYPNIEPLKTWDTVSWTTTTGGGSSITCDTVDTETQTTIQTGISSGRDISGDGMECEYIDFVFHYTDGTTNPELDTFVLAFTTGRI